MNNRMRERMRERGRGGHGDHHEWDHEGHGRRGGGRMRRGDIRTALLVALGESTAHGYDLIQSLEAKTGGAWRPSPGSVYPTLQLLEDEGLVRSSERDGKRVYEITDAGREEAARRTEEAGGTPWDLAARGRGNVGELREAVGQLHMAMRQVATAGTREQIDRAVEIVVPQLRDARRKIYEILSE
jgi:DNA-binding PadR family transcriptional regulator